MKMYKLTQRFFLCLLLGVAISSGSAIAQDGAKMREKVEQLKKVKLIEILDMNEDAAEKFFARYNVYENKVNDAFKEVQQAVGELNSRIDRKAPDAEIKSQNDIVLQKQNALHAQVDEKLKAMRSLLTEEQYAKFIVFENKFTQKLREILQRRGNQNRQ